MIKFEAFSKWCPERETRGNSIFCRLREAGNAECTERCGLYKLFEILINIIANPRPEDFE